MATLQPSTVNGLRFGRGNSAIVTNTAFGLNSLISISSGACNTGFGFNTLNNKTSGGCNTAFGAQALAASNNSRNTGIGRLAGFNVGGYAGGTHVGAQAGRYADHCTVTIGFQAGYYSQNYAVSVGHRAGVDNGAYTVAVGFKAKESGAPANSVFFSSFAGQNATIGANSVLGGHYTGRYSGGATNNVLVGWYSYQIFGYGSSDQSVLGRGNNTAYNCVFVGWTNVSDCRDKTNIQPLTNLGLNFIRKLNPVKYKWDRRQNYVDECGFEYGVKDGTLKQDKVQYGFLAQEIEFAAKTLGENFDAVSYDSFRDHYTLNYLNLVSSLVKSLQEINSELDLIETQLNS
jgi:hypothetical protein